MIYLTFWSPAAGYHVEEVARGPAATASIELEPINDGDDRSYAIGCADGRPRATAIEDDDDDDADD
ncbi:hypothetical protein [Streptomyces sp. H27-D2]|uniref:hypothetical protein n=1 Tax=Streptomyces sp. H27-D2 TaxID=3046304 RepID=UPI002DB79FB3|nr:hypothetical protein [Streptomyces sp. H27-D2]MEC4016451.1 hypothetical protein [Streptomyces sp. H27-D2]